MTQMDEAYKQKLSAPVHSTLLDDFGFKPYIKTLYEKLVSVVGVQAQHILLLEEWSSRQCERYPYFFRICFSNKGLSFHQLFTLGDNPVKPLWTYYLHLIKCICETLMINYYKSSILPLIKVGGRSSKCVPIRLIGTRYCQNVLHKICPKPFDI